MSIINDRLADYIKHPQTRCKDPRWEGILEDMLAGRIALEFMLNHHVAWIEVDAPAPGGHLQ